MSTSLIVTRVGVLLKPLGQAKVSTDDIYAHLAMVNDDLEMDLQTLNLNFDEQEIILPGVPANTIDLSTYQATGQLLGGLVLPVSLEWRLVGENQEQWRPVDRVGKKLETDTGTGEVAAPVKSDTAGIISYEWRNGVIQISPSNVATDLRVRFQGLPRLVNADNPTDPIRGLVNPLAYATAGLIYALRGGEAMTSNAEAMMKRYVRSLAAFETQQVKANNAETKRFGGRRAAMSGGDQWNTGLRPPVL